MTLEQLIRFAKVAETLSFTSAAEEMFIGLSTISKSVSDLEKEMGVNLLIRTKQGILLTAAGQLMADETGRILKQIHAMNRRVVECARRGEGGSLIVAAHTLVSQNLTQLYGDYMMRYPNDNLLVIQKDYGELGKMIRDGDADVGVMFSRELEQEEGDFGYAIVDYCKMCVAVSPDHPLCTRDAVSVADLENENLIVALDHEYSTNERPEIENLFRCFPIKKAVGSQETLIEAVRANQAIGLSPDYVMKASAADLIRLPVSDFPETMNLCVIWAKDIDKTSLRQFVSIVKEHYTVE